MTMAELILATMHYALKMCHNLQPDWSLLLLVNMPVILTGCRVAPFPGSSAWAEKKGPGVHTVSACSVS